MKRTAFRISLVMLLGVMTSIAVAWGCLTVATRAERLAMVSGPASAAEVLTSREFYKFETCGGNEWHGNTRILAGCAFAFDRPGSSADQQTPKSRKGSAFWWLSRNVDHLIARDAFGAGWPVLCLRGERKLLAPYGTEVPCGYWIIAGDSEDGIALPYHPIFPGLLANTAVYGGVWWAMLFGPGMIIRWRRRRAGRCAKCGYDLRGLSPDSECPECGAER